VVIDNLDIKSQSALYLAWLFAYDERRIKLRL
jgi:hypothetical protein